MRITRVYSVNFPICHRVVLALTTMLYVTLPGGLTYLMGFPSLAGKEFACNTGDTGLIPGSGRTPGEGISYPLQYSWVFLVAQTVQNSPAM